MLLDFVFVATFYAGFWEGYKTVWVTLLTSIYCVKVLIPELLTATSLDINLSFLKGSRDSLAQICRTNLLHARQLHNKNVGTMD